MEELGSTHGSTLLTPAQARLRDSQSRGAGRFKTNPPNASVRGVVPRRPARGLARALIHVAGLSPGEDAVLVKHITSGIGLPANSGGQKPPCPVDGPAAFDRMGRESLRLIAVKADVHDERVGGIDPDEAGAGGDPSHPAAISGNRPLVVQVSSSVVGRASRGKRRDISSAGIAAKADQRPAGIRGHQPVKVRASIGQHVVEHDTGVGERGRIHAG